MYALSITGRCCLAFWLGRVLLLRLQLTAAPATLTPTSWVASQVSTAWPSLLSSDQMAVPDSRAMPGPEPADIKLQPACPALRLCLTDRRAGREAMLHCSWLADCCRQAARSCARGPGGQAWCKMRPHSKAQRYRPGSCIPRSAYYVLHQVHGAHIPILMQTAHYDLEVTVSLHDATIMHEQIQPKR